MHTMWDPILFALTECINIVSCIWPDDGYDMIYLLTAVRLTPGGSSTVHIYTLILHRTTQIKTIHRTTQITTEQHK